MNDEVTAEKMCSGEHLTMIRQGRWEYVTRNTNRPAVGIVAITDGGDVVLVEQPRPPVGHSVVEIPAGLAGDIVGAEDEALLEAAKRELLEETGYVATQWIELAQSYSSPGLSDESVHLYLAEGLEKVAEGGGDEHEEITIHEVPLASVAGWLDEHEYSMDLKSFAGLYLASQHSARST